MPKNEYFFKILILGDSTVGKTCFLTRYTDKRFEPNYLATVGIDYKLKNIKLNDNKTVKLQIWDTIGQDRFRSITKNYYKGAQGIVLIYDITEKDTFKSVKEWVKSIKNEADKKVVVILVGNKIDCIEERKVSKEEGENLAQELSLPFYECSAKTDTNINEVFTDLVDKLVINFPNNGGKGLQLKQKQVGGAKTGCC